MPWVDPVLRILEVKILLTVIGLALVNVIVPIAILRLAARRRPWSIRLLMALPVAAAVPLTVFQARESLIPAHITPMPVSSRLVFLLGTLAGLPIVLYAVSAAGNLISRRWQTLAALLGLTFLSSMIIAAAWLWADMRNMPEIEHYDRSNGSLAAVPGAYAVGVLLMIAWPLRPSFRRIKRSGGESSPPRN